MIVKLQTLWFNEGSYPALIPTEQSKEDGGDVEAGLEAADEAGGRHGTAPALHIRGRGVPNVILTILLQ